MKLKKVSSKYVHKNNDDDVLIANSRPVIPTYLHNTLIEKLSDSLNPDKYSALKSVYRSSESYYILRTLPDHLSKTDIELLNTQYDLFEQYDQNFGATSKNWEFLLPEWLYEHHEVLLQKMFMPNSPLLNHEEKKAIKLTLEEINYPNLPKAQYFTFYNDIKHYFFYRKEHEHVPGTMLIEAARQAMYKQFYTCNPSIQGRATISISQLDCQFFNYCESFYPVDIAVFDNQNEKTQGMKLKNVDKTANFFQNEELIASIHLKGRVMMNGSFKRLRDPSISLNHWFSPLASIQPTVLLLCIDGSQYQVNLILISMSGITISSDIDLLNLGGELQSCIIYINTIGFLSLPISCLTALSDTTIEKKFIAHFAKLNQDKNTQLRRIIKQYTCFSYDNDQIRSKG